MKKVAAILVLMFFAGIGVILVIFGVNSRLSAPKPIDPYQPPIEMIVPGFSVIDRHGNAVTHELLDGEYTVLDFFFTSCPLYCPGMTAAMRRVQSEVGSESLRLMSISIDGSNDTPEVIGRYADGFGIDASRWVFATGPTQTVWPIIDELGFEVAFDTGTTVNSPEGDSMPMINHPTRLMLVGPDRKILGLYRYTDAEEIDALIARLNSLLD